MKYSHSILIGFGLAAAALLSGCDQHGSFSNSIGSAKAHLAKNDIGAAKLALKSELQANPNSAEARFLMGKLLVREGSFESAALEFAKAQDLKYPIEIVAPALAQTQLSMGLFKKIIDSYGEMNFVDANATADLATSLAAANAMQGDLQHADSWLARAFAAVPNFPAALLLQARLRGSQGGAGSADEALLLVDSAIKGDPGSIDGWQLKGDLLLYGKRQFDLAIEAYHKALELDRTVMRSHVNLVTALLMARKTEEAQKQFEQMKKAFPAHAQTVFLEAQFTVLKGHYKAASEMFGQLLRVAPDNIRLLTLAGANELQLGALVQAEAYLGKAVKLAPEQMHARRMLGQVYLRTGQNTKLLEVLKPLLARADADADSLYLGAMAYLQSGNAARAEVFFARASSVAPNDPKIGTAAALRQLSRGDSVAAFAALSSIAAGDKGEIADLATIGAHVRRREFDAALTAVDALSRKFPQQPFVEDLRGRVQLGMKNVSEARASFERAGTLSPAYFPSVGRLAALDLSEGRPEEARKRIEAVLKVDPKNNDALLARADLRFKMGGSVDEVAELYRQAQRANPGEKGPLLALAEFLLGSRQASKALVAAQDALVALPHDVDVLDVLGRAQIAAGNVQQAVSTFGKLASQQPDSPLPPLRLAVLYTIRGEVEAASAQYKRLLELDPSNLAAQQGLIQLSLRNGKVDAALAVARGIQKQRPTAALGYALEGDIQRQVKSWPAAREAYQRGIGKTGDAGYLATKVHSALLAEQRRPDAARYAEAWVKAHPKDAMMSFHLGMVALVQKDLPEAERWFRSTVERSPDHARALNNLAWVTAELQKPGAAALIARALVLLPDQPDFLDTQSHVLDLAGDTQGALAALKKASDLAPAQTSYRLGLARLQIKSGEKASARRLLEDLASLASAPPSDRSEAKRLLAAL